MTEQQWDERESEYKALCKKYKDQPGTVAYLTEQYIKGNAQRMKHCTNGGSGKPSSKE